MPTIANGKIEHMPTKEFRKKFDDAPFNPKGRTSDRAVAVLRKTMRKHGFLRTNPIIVHGKHIADGHRRLRAAELEQVPEVYFIRADMDVTLDELWADLNGTVRAPSVREAGEAVALGLKVAPPNRERVLTQLAEVAGSWDAMRKILQKKVSPGIVLIAQRVANYCYMEEEGETRNEFIVRTIQWLIDHKAHSKVRSALDERGISPEALYDKISNNQPLVGKWE